MEERVKQENVFPFLTILYKNLIVIIIITILIGVLGSFIGYFTTKPVYTKRCEIMLRVELASGNTITNSTSAAKDYLPTVASAIKSPATMELAKRINGEENIDNGIKRNAVSVSYPEFPLKAYGQSLHNRVHIAKD
jgi:capsular polysaccharide biosynthesis protein